jgi:hypothetical protein
MRNIGSLLFYRLADDIAKYVLALSKKKEVRTPQEARKSVMARLANPLSHKTGNPEWP